MWSRRDTKHSDPVLSDLVSSQLFCIIISASHTQSLELFFLWSYPVSESHLPGLLPGLADWIAQTLTPCLFQTAMLHLPGKISQNLTLDSQMPAANWDHSLSSNAITFESCVLPTPRSAPLQLDEWGLTDWTQHVFQDEQIKQISLYNRLLPHSTNPFKSPHNRSWSPTPMKVSGNRLT